MINCLIDQSINYVAPLYESGNFLHQKLADHIQTHTHYEFGMWFNKSLGCDSAMSSGCGSYMSLEYCSFISSVYGSYMSLGCVILWALDVNLIWVEFGMWILCEPHKASCCAWVPLLKEQVPWLMQNPFLVKEYGYLKTSEQKTLLTLKLLIKTSF